MDDTGFRYDVAFSFLAQDEGIATQLSDLVQERVTTFLYSRRQEELAGKDGEVAFNSVFGKEARLVVVLYRQGWGERGWTQIECNAIRNRAFDNGYSFATFIPLDEPPTLPKWLPKTQIYVGLKRWGLNGAASVIEARVAELGGEPKQESVIKMAARFERAMSAQKRRKEYLNSRTGVDAADKAFASVVTAVEEVVATITKNTKLSLSIKKRSDQIVVFGRKRAISVSWERHYANSLDGAQLTATLWDSHPPMSGVMLYEQPNRLRTINVAFDFDGVESVGWRLAKDDDRLLSDRDVGEYFINCLIAEEQEQLQK